MTLKCSISECRADAVTTVSIGFREKRNLCRRHYAIFKNKDGRFSPDFKKASEINQKPSKPPGKD